MSKFAKSQISFEILFEIDFRHWLKKQIPFADNWSTYPRFLSTDANSHSMFQPSFSFLLDVGILTSTVGLPSYPAIEEFRIKYLETTSIARSTGIRHCNEWVKIVECSKTWIFARRSHPRKVILSYLNFQLGMVAVQHKCWFSWGPPKLKG